MAETLAYTTWQDWVDRAESVERLLMFAPGDTDLVHPKVTKAETSAIGIMESYLRRRGVVTPLDLPLPEEVKQHLISIGFGFLTMRSETRPDSIDANYMDAKAYFKEISLGHMTIPDLVPGTLAGSASATDFFFNHRALAFDEDDDTSILSNRMPPL